MAHAILQVFFVNSLGKFQLLATIQSQKENPQNLCCSETQNL